MWDEAMSTLLAMYITFSESMSTINQGCLFSWGVQTASEAASCILVIKTFRF